MTSPGTILRRARAEKGLDLSAVAAQLKVNRKYLEAMEADDWKSLPGGFFYKSFVRQYADALGLDPNEIDRALAEMHVEEAALPTAVQLQERVKPHDLPPVGGGSPMPVTRMLPSIGLLLAVVVGCSILYTWWHRIESRVRANEAGTPVASAAKRPAVAPTETHAVVPQTTELTAAEQPAAQAGTAAAPPAATQPATSSDGVHITLAATEDTWVSVTSDGHNVFSGVIRSQESRNVEGRENTRIKIGNAGGVNVEWNGRAIGPLGKRGEVRDVLFTRDSYKLIEKTPPPDEDNSSAPPEATT